MSKRFKRVFGGRSAAKQFAPGRVNLIGEHTDYNGGNVLPMVIERGVRVEVGPSLEPHDRYYSVQMQELTDRLPDASLSDHWRDYVGGIVDACRLEFSTSDRYNIYIESDIPTGAGVSSSAALMIAIAKAIRSITGAEISDMAIAKMAQRVENDYLGVPCGLMDQASIALAAKGEAVFLSCARIEYSTVRMPDEFAIMVFHSGLERALNDGRYAVRRRECEAAAEALGVAYLCQFDGPLDAVDTLETSLRRRARHVITDHRRVSEMVKAIEDRDRKAAGDLLLAGHRSLSHDFQVSLPELDDMVQAAVDAGAYGARLTGGGFGGCFVALADPGEQGAIAARLQEKYDGVSLIHPILKG